MNQMEVEVFCRTNNGSIQRPAHTIRANEQRIIKRIVFRPAAFVKDAMFAICM